MVTEAIKLRIRLMAEPKSNTVQPRPGGKPAQICGGSEDVPAGLLGRPAGGGRDDVAPVPPPAAEDEGTPRGVPSDDRPAFVSQGPGAAGMANGDRPQNGTKPGSDDRTTSCTNDPCSRAEWMHRAGTAGARLYRGAAGGIGRRWARERKASYDEGSRPDVERGSVRDHGCGPARPWRLMCEGM
jgi:hypothetical protein